MSHQEKSCHYCKHCKVTKYAKTAFCFHPAASASPPKLMELCAVYEEDSRCDFQRAASWPVAVLHNRCGKAGRWFELSESELEMRGKMAALWTGVSVNEVRSGRWPLMMGKEETMKEVQVQKIRDAIKALQAAINEADDVQDIWLQVERGHIGIDTVGQNVEGFVIKAKIIQETVVT